MALVFKFCGSGGSTSAATSYTVDTNAATPSADSLLVAVVINSLASSPLDPTGVTGHGETYAQIALSARLLSTTHTMSVWVAKATSPTSTAVVADFGAVNQTGCIVHEFGITGADLSGTAAAAIVQNPTATGTATSNTATNLLAAAGASGNLAMAFWARLYNEAAASVGGNWAEVTNADTNYNTPRTALESQVTATTYDRSPGATWSNNVVYRVVALEVKADANVSIAPGVGSGVVGGLAPSLLTNYIRATDAGSAAVTGLAPVALLGSVMQPTTGAGVVGGFAPSLLHNAIFQPGAGSGVVGGLAPVVVQDVIRQPGLGSAEVSGLAPTATVSGSGKNLRVSWGRVQGTAASGR